MGKMKKGKEKKKKRGSLYVVEPVVEVLQLSELSLIEQELPTCYLIAGLGS